MTGAFLSLPRYDWCAPLSHLSSWMLVNRGLSQQSSKAEYKPWKWGTAARYYTSHTKTMLPMRKSVPRSSRQLDHMKKLETVTSFKYLGSVVTDEGSKPEMLSSIAQTTAALTGWNQFGMTGVFLSVSRYVWCDPLSHSLSCKLWIMDTYSRAPKKNTSRGNEMLLISYKDIVTNEEICAKIHQAIRPHEDLMIIKRHKLQWYGHVPVHQVWPWPSCKEQWKWEEDKADRGRGRKATSGSGGLEVAKS